MTYFWVVSVGNHLFVSYTGRDGRTLVGATQGEDRFLHRISFASEGVGKKLSVSQSQAPWLTWNAEYPRHAALWAPRKSFITPTSLQIVSRVNICTALMLSLVCKARLVGKYSKNISIWHTIGSTTDFRDGTSRHLISWLLGGKFTDDMRTAARTTTWDYANDKP